MSEKNPKDFFELKSDGTFYLQTHPFEQNPPSALLGRYSVERDIINFRHPDGQAIKAKIEGNTISNFRGDDGDRWTKF